MPPFVITKHLGSGSFGTVVEAIWDGKVVAVKQIRDGLATAYRAASAIKEASILRQLNGGDGTIIRLFNIYIPPQPAQPGSQLLAGSRGVHTATEGSASICASADPCASSSIDALVNAASTPVQVTPPISQNKGYDSRYTATTKSEILSSDAATPQSTATQNPSSDIYLIMERMPTDLGRVIRSPIYLTGIQIAFIFRGILRSLNFCHMAGIIHRDLKPSNILIDSECHVKIADFGQADLIESSIERRDITTSWYRAPEILLQNFYSPQSDVWAAGCILGDLLEASQKPLHLRRPLFAVDHNIDSTPDTDESSSEIMAHYRYICAEINLGLARRFPAAPSQALALLNKLLCLDPHQRITVQAALEHPWLRLNDMSPLSSLPNKVIPEWTSYTPGMPPSDLLCRF